MLADMSWIDVLPLAAIVTDSSGKIVAINPLTVDLFGYPTTELIGMSIDRLVPDGARQKHAAHRAAYNAAPRQRPMAAGQYLTGRRRDGIEVPVTISLTPLDAQHTMALIETAQAAQRAVAQRYQERTDELIQAQRQMIALATSIDDLTRRVSRLEQIEQRSNEP